MLFKIKLWWKRRKKRNKQENKLKNAAAIGTCRHCGAAWNWKESAIINYYKGRGMFPICKDCFEELSSKEILYYAAKKWGEDMLRSRLDGCYTKAQKSLSKKQFLERALENIRRKKKGKQQKYGNPECMELYHSE